MSVFVTIIPRTVIKVMIVKRIAKLILKILQIMKRKMSMKKKSQRESKCNERLRSNLKFVSTRFALLEIAKTRVETPDGQKSKYLGILFDTGSQVCFITRTAKGLLHLVAKGSKKFSIK